MIDPNDGYTGEDTGAAMMPPQQPSMFPNFPVSEEEQKEIAQICNQFKQAAKAHSKDKKQTLRTCYAYTKNKFVGNDLLPTPSTYGSDKDIEKSRPKVFIPLVRQTLKQLYSYLKLTIFPNDEDYFRVRGKDMEAVQFEDILTEGLKYKFAEALISEKIGAFLYNLVWAGNAAAYPCVKDDIRWEWTFDSMMNQYVATEVDTPPMPDIECFSPLDFNIDSNEPDPEKAKWGVFITKKVQEIKDSQLYFNKDRLSTIAKSGGLKNQSQSDTDLTEFNGLTNNVANGDKAVDYDFYYYPYIKTSTQEYRNMLIGIAGEEVVVRFHPNMAPGGLNPAVFCNWTPDVDTLYGTGPIEDILELQRLTNILYNYMIEVLARIGNRFKVTEGVDLSNLFGVAGGVATIPMGGDIVPFTGDYAEPQFLANVIGTAKAEAQITSGSQNPFQGSSNVDFKKTATELQIIQENSISVMREVIEHVSVMGVQRLLERLMFLCADLYQEPIPIPMDDPATGQRIFMPVDFSMLKSGRFTIELVGVNPSQSKQAQVEGLTQLLQVIGTNPDVLMIGEPVIQKIGELQGIKDIGDILRQIIERLQGLAAQQPVVPGEEAGVGANPDGSVGEVPPPAAA
jgi:hypothetical protein